MALVECSLPVLSQRRHLSVPNGVTPLMAICRGTILAQPRPRWSRMTMMPAARAVGSRRVPCLDCSTVGDHFEIEGELVGEHSPPMLSLVVRGASESV